MRFSCCPEDATGVASVGSPNQRDNSVTGFSSSAVLEHQLETNHRCQSQGAGTHRQQHCLLVCAGMAIVLATAGTGFKCQLCGEKRSDLGFGNCQVKPSAPILETVMQGSLADFKKACRDRRQPRLAARASARQIEAVALAVCSQAATAAPCAFSQPPQWMIDTATRHVGGQFK